MSLTRQGYTGAGLPDTPKTKKIPPVAFKKRATPINVMDALSTNTQINYKIDLSLFAYWLQGYEDADYLKEMELPTDGHKLIPKNDVNHIVHLELPEVAGVFMDYEITPDIVAAWIQDIGFRYKLPTIRRKLSALNWAFQVLKMDVVSAYPAVKQTMKVLGKLQDKFKGSKITREEIKAKGFTPPPPLKKGSDFELKQAEPFRLTHLQEVLGFLTYGKHGWGENRVARDKAIISVIWHGLFRRSELADIRIENIKFVASGMSIRLYDIKNHSDWTQRINYANNSMLCPVRLTQAWLEKRGGLDAGWLFTSVSKADRIKNDPNKKLDGRDIMRILQACTEKVGISIKFSGHSPRAGGATEIYVHTHDAEKVKRTGGWNSEAYLKYIRTVEEEDFDSSGMKGIT